MSLSLLAIVPVLLNVAALALGLIAWRVRRPGVLERCRRWAVRVVGVGIALVIFGAFVGWLRAFRAGSADPTQSPSAVAASLAETLNVFAFSVLSLLVIPVPIAILLSIARGNRRREAARSVIRELLQTRPATRGDRRFLKDLHHRAYRDVVVRQFGDWDERAQDTFFANALGEAVYEIVEYDGAPVGALGTREEALQLLLVAMQVVPEWQNKGIGTALLEAQIKRGIEAKKPLRLSVLRQNRARRLYERQGFVVESESETHYSMRREAERAPIQYSSSGGSRST